MGIHVINAHTDNHAESLFCPMKLWVIVCVSGCVILCVSVCVTYGGGVCRMQSGACASSLWVAFRTFLQLACVLAVVAALSSGWKLFSFTQDVGAAALNLGAEAPGGDWYIN